MKLLVEADRNGGELHRGEYRVEGVHVDIACPDCGSVLRVYRRTFAGHFQCGIPRCGWEGPVKLTGERSR